MESIRDVMRRRAAWLMAAIVSGFTILLWITKVFIATTPDPEFVIYSPHEEEAPQEQKKREEISVNAPPVTPPLTDIVVTNPVNPVSDFTLDIDVTTDMPISDTGMLGGMGGDGLGDGVGRGSRRGGMGGSKAGSAFAGVFYDLKKKRDGSDSALKPVLANTEVLNLESRFYNTRWELSVFSLYYRAKQQLYASCFYMPNCMDEEACNAYDPEGKLGLKPSRWVAVYRAKVKAPVSGTFRFVGYADSLMAVRFDGKNVLACGLHDLVKAEWSKWTLPPDAAADSYKIAAERGFVPYKECERWNEQTGGFAPGEPFTVKAGQWYEMQVMVSEIGGIGFGFCLFIDEVDAEKKRTKDGQPLFQLFRTDFSEPSGASAYEAIKYPIPGDDEGKMRTDPPYDPDSRVWQAQPIGPDTKMK